MTTHLASGAARPGWGGTKPTWDGLYRSLRSLKIEVAKMRLKDRTL
jgi:hypothetical protein